MNQYILYALILVSVFFIYLLFTQPQNALYYLERFFVTLATIFGFVFKIIYALAKGIVNLFRRRG
jgi:hypothetical protein